MRCLSDWILKEEQNYISLIFPLPQGKQRQYIQHLFSFYLYRYNKYRLLQSVHLRVSSSVYQYKPFHCIFGILPNLLLSPIFLYQNVCLPRVIFLPLSSILFHFSLTVFYVLKGINLNFSIILCEDYNGLYFGHNGTDGRFLIL